MDTNFSCFVPINIIEKADSKIDKDGLPEELLIGGVVSSPKKGFDKDGQLLDPNGFDYRPLLKSGFLNLEHAYVKTKDPSMIVGEPTNAFVKDDDFHIEGKLYKDNPKAVALYKLGQILKKSGSTRTIGYSLEGNATEYDPTDKRKVKKAVINHVALTISPKCDGTKMDILSKGGEYEVEEGSEYLIDIKDGDVHYIVDKDLNILEKGGEGSKGGKVIGHTRTGKPIYDSYSHKEHKNFTKEDHYDASVLHNKKKESSVSEEEKKHHGKQAHHHGQDVATHRDLNSKPGEKEDRGKKYWNFINEHKEESNKNADKYLSKAMMAGSVTGRETTDQSLTQEPLKEESIDGVVTKKKKSKKISEKEILTKSEIAFELFSIFNLDVDSAKRVYDLTERIQRQLTPMAEVKKVSQEAFQKALETLNLVEAPAATAQPAAAVETKSPEELAKAALQDELKKAEETVAGIKAKLEGKTEAPVAAATEKKEDAPKTTELTKAVEDKISAIGTIAAKAVEDSAKISVENAELKKGIDQMVAFNNELAKKLGMIAEQPLDRKSVSTQQAIERFGKDNLEKGGEAGASGVKTYSISDKKQRAEVADLMYKATVAAGFDENGKPKDVELFKATQYMELGSFPNAAFARSIQQRMIKEHKIQLVK